MRCNVLGLGPSLRIFQKELPAGITVGVNDIWKRYRVDYVVCIDKPDVFAPERREVIEQCTPAAFYSHIDLWEQYHGERFRQLNLTGRFAANKFDDWNALPRGLDSTYIACMVAYHLGARGIVLYGADFIGHPNLDEPGKIKRIQDCYRALEYHMRVKNCRLYLGGGDGALKGILPTIK